MNNTFVRSRKDIEKKETRKEQFHGQYLDGKCIDVVVVVDFDNLVGLMMVRLQIYV
jgi:hypothetical protein